MTTAPLPGRGWQRVLGRLSPFGVPRRPSEWAVDSLLFVLALLFWWWFSLPEVNPQIQDWFWPVDRGFGLAACLLLWWTRRYPVACAVLVLVPGTIAVTAGFPTLVAVYRVALRARPRTSLPITVLHVALALPYHAVAPIPDVTWLAWLIVLPLIYALAYCLGLLGRARQQVIDGLRASAARDREIYERRLIDTRRQERERIAREMHDVLAHRISLLSVHAGALEYRAGSATALSPDEVRQAATVIRENAHLAVEDLRDLLELLRQDQGELGTGRPQPRLSDLVRLADEALAAGQRVDLRIDVDAAALRDSVQRTAYRVVQESLTNARKHAPGAAVMVRVTGDDGSVRVLIDNPVPIGLTNADLDDRARRGTPSGGAGLIGLAERVRLDGGSLHSGIEAGRFRVLAELPVGTR
jgi:signal transduction histidine kinase